MSDHRRDKVQKGELPRAGDVLQGKYRLEGNVASGGMGVIMRAEHLKMERDVAVKLLHPHLASDEGTVQRFEREIHLAKVLSHPNVIQLLDYGRTDGGALYIVMEYLEGRDLDDLLDEQGALDLDRACDIGLQILDGLAEAHDNNVVHRDLKPSNVFLTRRRRGGEHVKLLDFGIAKSLEGAANSITATGQICGTAMYLPPESVFQRAPGKRGDVYAVGLIILEMLLGRRIFDAGTLPQTLMLHVQKPIPMPSALTDTAVGEVLKNATVKHPDDRYPDAEAMLSDLAEAVDELGEERTVDPDDITHTGTSLDNETLPGFNGENSMDMEMLRDIPSHESADAIPASAPPGTPQPHGAPPKQQAPSRSSGAPSDFPGGADDSQDSADTVVTPQPRRPGSSEFSPADSQPVQEPKTMGERSDWLIPTIGAGAALLALALVAASFAVGSTDGRDDSEAAGEKSTASNSPSKAASDDENSPGVTGEAQRPDAGSVNRGESRTVRLQLVTDPPGAEVRLQGETVGTTPKFLTIDRQSPAVEVTLQKQGFEDSNVSLDPADSKRRYKVQLSEAEPSEEKPAPPPEERTRDDESPEPEPPDKTRQPPDPEPQPSRTNHEPSGSGSTTDEKEDNSDPFENIADDYAIE